MHAQTFLPNIGAGRFLHQTSSQQDRLFCLLDSGGVARQGASVDQTKTKQASA